MPRIDKTSLPVTVRRSLPGFTEQLLEPFSRLRSEVDQLFNDFPVQMPYFRLGRIGNVLPIPAVEMTETNDAYKLSVEVPGMDAADIEVSVEDNMLCICGEKKEEREEKERGFMLSERSYGSFDRRIELPSHVDPDKIDAKVKNGVLHITLPRDKKAEEQKRRIKVKAV